MMVEYRIVKTWAGNRQAHVVERRLGGTDTWMPMCSTVRGETAAREMLSAMLSPDRAVVAEFDFRGQEIRKAEVRVKHLQKTVTVFEVVDPQGRVLGEFDTYSIAKAAEANWNMKNAI